jgi:hypothetical protein
MKIPGVSRPLLSLDGGFGRNIFIVAHAICAARRARPPALGTG